MPNTQLGDTEQVTYAVAALDADSNPAQPQAGDISSVVASAPTSITVVPDTTPVAGSVMSGKLLGTATLASGVVITYAYQAAGTGPTLTATDTIDVVGGAATSISVSLGTPTAQTSGLASSIKRN